MEATDKARAQQITIADWAIFARKEEKCCEAHGKIMEKRYNSPGALWAFEDDYQMYPMTAKITAKRLITRRGQYPATTATQKTLHTTLTPRRVLLRDAPLPSATMDMGTSHTFKELRKRCWATRASLKASNIAGSTYQPGTR